ncbi:hypothetical protein BCEP4_320101 [Burkholderia cepacia]|nr:hypothetical protein BCEP4_320101 [Burkholderia cepacia]
MQAAALGRTAANKVTGSARLPRFVPASGTPGIGRTAEGTESRRRQIVMLLASIHRTAQSRACAIASPSSLNWSSIGKKRFATSSPSLDREITT